MKTRYFNNLMALAILGIGLSDDFYGSDNFYRLSDKELKELVLISKEKRRCLLLSKPGVSEYTFEGITVIARNEKNAIRKINNIKKQLENEFISQIPSKNS
jgi:hypothetical protein